MFLYADNCNTVATIVRRAVPNDQADAVSLLDRIRQNRLETKKFSLFGWKTQIDSAR